MQTFSFIHSLRHSTSIPLIDICHVLQKALLRFLYWFVFGCYCNCIVQFFDLLRFDLNFHFNSFISTFFLSGNGGTFSTNVTAVKCSGKWSSQGMSDDADVVGWGCRQFKKECVIIKSCFISDVFFECQVRLFVFRKADSNPIHFNLKNVYEN